MALPANDPRTDWYRRMVEIRVFEEKAAELYAQGLVHGTIHSSQGQEAVAVGAVSALNDDDYMTITHRSHGQAIARGLSVDAALAELMGRSTGCSGGVGGSMHLIDVSRGLLGSFAIVGAGIPVAVGAALSAKLRGSGQVSVAFFGDGAVAIGSFHEAVNMAAVWKAPVIFLVENNLYGQFSPIHVTSPIKDIANRAASYAIPGVIVDGQDVQAVYDVMRTAVERARAGDGPTLIEAKTYRYRGHSRTDPAKYRPEGELERWRARDPIELLGKVLAADGLLSQDQQEELKNEVRSQIDTAATRAADGPFPTAEEMHSYVFAD
jgi:acetoin:2,6-dichlorophenolindophenol oxidoreductase subunit alpha